MNLAQTCLGEDPEALVEARPFLSSHPGVHGLLVELSRGPWYPVKSVLGAPVGRAAFRHGSVPERAMMAIREAGRPLTPAEVRALIPEANAKQVSVALSDMAARHILEASGNCRRRRYGILSPEAAERCAREAEEEEEEENL